MWGIGTFPLLMVYKRIAFKYLRNNGLTDVFLEGSMTKQVDSGKGQKTIDFLVSRVPRLEAEIIKQFCQINRLRRKDLFVILFICKG